MKMDTPKNMSPGDSEHFVDSAHFTDCGRRVMVIRVFNALLREGLMQAVINRRQTHQ